MKKINILHIITRLNAGGAQELALSIASGLDKEIFNVTFVSGSQDYYEDLPRKWNINAIIIPDLIREIHPFKDLIALIRLYSFIKNKDFDIVHTHTSKAGILGRIAAKLAGVPLIFHTPHGSIFHSIYYGPVMIFLLSRVENFAASFTDIIIACSRNEKEDLLEHGIATDDKYNIVHSGIVPDDFLKVYDRVSKRRELSVEDDVMLFGNIARLVPEKGHLFCLEAFKTVVDQFSHIKLLIVGDGKLRQDIEAKIVELNLENNVTMVGHRNDVAEILASLDISLHTSMWEGMPLAIMEAMLMKKAIIATKVGGIPEMIQDGITGILIEPNDKKALVHAITILIKNRALAKKIGESACQYAKEEFTLNSMIANMSKLYQRQFALKSNDI